MAVTSFFFFLNQMEQMELHRVRRSKRDFGLLWNLAADKFVSNIQILHSLLRKPISSILRNK